VSAHPQQQDWLWTAPQRRALILLLAILCCVLGVRLLFNPAYIADPQVSAGARSNEVATQLDPNSATWEELAAIPTMGEKRAKAIVAYREKQLEHRPNDVIFKTADDLTHVKGIAKATASNVKPYLLFPSAAK
jgi:competence ComEA-like helix-hairpin-helix protein